MYIFAEPFLEDEIDAIQTGEYIQALRMAEARARAEKEKKKPETESTTNTNETLNISEASTSSEADDTTEVEASENEDSDQSADMEIPQFPIRDLLAMVLKAQNYINGQQITGPPTPSAEDRWEMTYTFETYPQDRGLRLYQMSQERRRKALDDEFREQALEENETAQKAKAWNSGFLKHLKDLSLRGKNWRDEFERTMGSREKVIWKEGPPPSNFGLVAWKEYQRKLEQKKDD
jgi:hypothetical protein